MKKLITAALPYVNNVPHLGNLIQVLSADVFARYSRLKKDDVLYICGTDEYGTATETKALQEGVSPEELCAHYHALHAKIYNWFGIAFDYFGRTSIPAHTEITQDIFLALHKNGHIKEHASEQFFCPQCERFLADRYILGECPHCGKEARGDQCESCGKLLEPCELKAAECSTCHSKPTLRETKHLYIDLPGIFPKYNEWLEATLKSSHWAHNAVQVTRGWIKEGLQERAITRDLKWGIPVPLEGYENKVFYVWFDAPIGYISLTKHFCDVVGTSWQDWWLDAKDVKLFQFIGKDNLPFHTVIFPSSLIGTGKNWTKLYRMSSTEYLNYEDGKFSKSKGVGVFGTDAMESEIPQDVWRFYIFYNRPEKSDFQFTWKDFKERVNSELVGNLCNLVNRTTSFARRAFEGKVPSVKTEGLKDDEKTLIRELDDAVFQAKRKVEEFMENGELKEAFHEVFALSDRANKAFQKGEPWAAIKDNPLFASSLIAELCYVIKDILILAHPFMPHYADEAIAFFGKKIFSGRTFDGKCVLSSQDATSLNWNDVGVRSGLEKLEGEHIIFKMLEEKKILEYQKKFSGKGSEGSKEKEGKQSSLSNKQKKEALSPIETFVQKIMLKTAKIVEVAKHPDADKLYVLKVDDGRGSERVILSGLVGFYEEEELRNKDIVIVDNLKPRKMRGINSHGMLLAASREKEDGSEELELVSIQGAMPGRRILLQKNEDEMRDVNELKEISADVFFSVPLKATDGVVNVEGLALMLDGEEVRLCNIKEGSVG